MGHFFNICCKRYIDARGKFRGLDGVRIIRICLPVADHFQVWFSDALEHSLAGFSVYLASPSCNCCICILMTCILHLSQTTSKCSSPMPFRTVWPVSRSASTRTEGSSRHITAKAASNASCTYAHIHLVVYMQQKYSQCAVLWRIVVAW